MSNPATLGKIVSLEHAWPRRQCPPPGKERGAILVLWVLCLGVLIASLALALNAGNISQQDTNAQDAANSAALAAAGEAGPHLPWDLTSLAGVPACDVGGYCPCPVHLRAGCSSYAWLDNYYIFAPSQGWLQIVPGSEVGPGQISDQEAFLEGLQAGWSCAPQPAWLGSQCFFVATHIPGWSPGALADSYAIAKVALAAQYAKQLADTYYHNDSRQPDWSACSSLPPGFALALPGESTCIAYEVTGSSIVFWLSVVVPAGPSWVLADGVSDVTAQAFATWSGGPSGQPVLCSTTAGSC